MIKRFCDWCGDQIAEGDLMPGGGGGVQTGLVRIGMQVGNAIRVDNDTVDDKTITVVVGPVSVDGVSNTHHFHKACVQAIVTSGVVQ